MTAYLAGIVQSRCADHPKASDIDGVMRAVLAAMAYPVRDARSKCADNERYLCTESVATIAQRCGFNRKVVMRAQERAADLDLVECLRAEPKKPRHWQIKIVMPENDMPPRGTSRTEHMSPRGTTHVPERDQSCPSEGHNPEESPGGLTEGDDDRATAGADGPGGPPLAAPSTGSPNGSVEREMSALSLSREAAQSWRERKLTRKPGQEPIRDETKWINSCIGKELEQRAAASSTDDEPAKDATPPPVRTYSMKPPKVAASVPGRPKITIRHSPSNGTTHG